MAAQPYHRLAHLRGEGAEFIAAGELLVRGVEAHKTYSRQQGFDLIAVGPTGRSVTIQVKSSIQAGVQFTANSLLADWFVFMRFRRDGETRDRYIVPRAALRSSSTRRAGWRRGSTSIGSTGSSTIVTRGT